MLCAYREFSLCVLQGSSRPIGQNVSNREEGNYYQQENKRSQNPGQNNLVILSNTSTRSHYTGDHRLT